MVIVIENVTSLAEKADQLRKAESISVQKPRVDLANDRGMVSLNELLCAAKGEQLGAFDVTLDHRECALRRQKVIERHHVRSYLLRLAPAHLSLLTGVVVIARADECLTGHQSTGSLYGHGERDTPRFAAATFLHQLH